MAIITFSPSRVISCYFLLYLLRESFPVEGFTRQPVSGDCFYRLHQSKHTVDEASKRKSPIEKSGAVLYKTSVFSRNEYSIIRKELASCTKHLQKEDVSSIAKNRLGMTLNPESAVVQVLREGSLRKFVQKSVGYECELSPNLPVELRTYEREGAGMTWHVDDVLYDPPQVEVVWTLENDSDCVTMWKDLVADEVRSIETEPNSAILLLAGGAPHCVTSLKRGKRVILKCAFVRKDSSFRQGLHKNQFQGKQMKKRTKKRR
jgi:hypothetical protein